MCEKHTRTHRSTDFRVFRLTLHILRFLGVPGRRPILKRSAFVARRTEPGVRSHLSPSVRVSTLVQLRPGPSLSPTMPAQVVGFDVTIWINQANQAKTGDYKVIGKRLACVCRGQTQFAYPAALPRQLRIADVPALSLLPHFQTSPT